MSSAKIVEVEVVKQPFKVPVGADAAALEAQLRQPVTHVKDDTTGREGIFYARKGTPFSSGNSSAPREEVYLTPNDSFFENTEKLRCRPKKPQDKDWDDHWNQGKCWGSITGCGSGHGVYWPFFLANTNNGNAQVSLRIRAKVAAGGPMAFQLIVNGTAVAILPVNGSAERYAMQCRMFIKEKGFHSLVLRQVQAVGGPKPKGNDVTLQYAKLVTGKHVGIAVVRERWRPLAAHTTFSCTQVPAPRACVMRFRKPPSQPCFAPLSTMFGYFGPVLNADHTAQGLNFSLWSYKLNAEAPPAHKLSRILCIGDPDAAFGHFTHEGTGVKVRNWNPWKNNTSGNFVVALRYREEPAYVFEDGQVYTFFGYFWDEGERRWRIFAVGQKFFPTQQRRLWVKGFVEAPGRAHRFRTNHAQRTVYYKGWVQDPDSKKWAQLDRISPASNHAIHKPTHFKTKPLTLADAEGTDGETGRGGGTAVHNANRSEEKEEVAEDLRDLYYNQRWGSEGQNFAVSIGGLRQTNARGSVPSEIQLEKVTAQLPEWMKQIAALDEELLFPKVAAHRFAGGTLELDINIPPSRNKDGEEVPPSKVWVFCGDADGLSIAEEWTDKLAVQNPQGGASTVRVELEQQPKYLRILVRDAVMQRWSEHTYPCENPRPTSGRSRL